MNKSIIVVTIMQFIVTAVYYFIGGNILYYVTVDAVASVICVVFHGSSGEKIDNSLAVVEHTNCTG